MPPAIALVTHDFEAGLQLAHQVIMRVRSRTNLIHSLRS
jgi:ABC-type nitrate/sulfonate/bicarbonate transport system ATPase subunit